MEWWVSRPHDGGWVFPGSALSLPQARPVPPAAAGPGAGMDYLAILARTSVPNRALSCSGIQNHGRSGTSDGHTSAIDSAS